MRFKYISVILFLSLFFFLSFGFAEAGNIVIRVVAVNPSKELSQKIQVKAYMPKEIKPENIVEKADLDVSYDTQEGAYYVFNEYELKPMETLERFVEIRDIWIIPEAEIQSLFSEADKIAGLLKDTEFEARAKFLLESIQNKLKAISENQKNLASNPEKHISDYRDNIKILESVKADLTMIKGFLSLAKPLSPVAIWKVIIIIFFFLGGLGLTFYILWYKQLKVMTTDDTFYVPDSENKQAQSDSANKK